MLIAVSGRLPKKALTTGPAAFRSASHKGLGKEVNVTCQQYPYQLTGVQLHLCFTIYNVLQFFGGLSKWQVSGFYPHQLVSTSTQRNVRVRKGEKAARHSSNPERSTLSLVLTDLQTVPKKP